MATVKKTIFQLRERVIKVLKSGRPKQIKKLKKAYGGRYLKNLWVSRASFEGLTIAECKDLEGVGNRMKRGHRHRKNYCICSVCGKWFRRNKGRHYDFYDETYHFCCGPCDEQAQFEAELEEEVGGGFCPHYWDDEGDAEWRRKNGK